MDTEAKRYNFVQEKSGLSKKDFAASLGLTKAHGFQVSSGRNKLSREVLELLSSLYRVNLHWLLTGEGSPSLADPDMVPIDLLEQEAAAGRGREVEDYPRRQPLYIPRSFIAPHRPEKLLAVYVSGDSMIEAGLNDGDIVIFHPGIKEGNGIYVLSERNSLLVKWVDFDLSRQTIVLISKNPLYQPRRFTGPELEEIKIAGRVLAWIHKP